MTELYLTWFPECTQEKILRKIVKSGLVDGIEMPHVNYESDLIERFGLKLSYHCPYLKSPGVYEIFGISEDQQTIDNLRHNLASSWILAPFYLEEMRDGIERTDLPFFSLHFGYSAERIRKMKSAPNEPLSPTLSREETLERIGRNVRSLKELIGLEVVVENTEYGPTGAVEYVCEPATINEFLLEYDCEFLLDISHAQISARPLGWEPLEYLRVMTDFTGKRIKEVHVNSCENLKDTHSRVTEDTVNILKSYVLDAYSPTLITLERLNTEEKQPMDFVDDLLDESKMIRRVMR